MNHTRLRAPAIFQTSAVLTLLALLTSTHGKIVNDPVWPYYLSNDGPITDLLSNETEFIVALRKIQEHLIYVESQTNAFIRNKTAPQPGQVLLPCQSAGHGTLKLGMKAHIKQRSLGELDVSCMTELAGVETFNSEVKPPHTEDELYDAIVTRAEVLFRRREDIVSRLKLAWKDSDVLYRFPFDRTSQRCLIHPVGAIRMDETWYTDTRITNFPILQYVPFGDRLHVSEYLRTDVKDNKLLNPLVLETHEKRADKFYPDEKKKQFVPRLNSTTMYTLQPSHPTPSTFQTMNALDNPALQAALEKSDIYVQQVEDALTPSSVAILFLPLALTLVPIASLAPVTTGAMLLYTLISDVLTAVPLATKGVELMVIGAQRHKAIVVRLAGTANGSIAGPGAAEVIAAECRALSYVRPTGIKFLATALFFMVFGVVMELVARNIRKRRDFRRQAWDGMATALLIENQRGLGFA